MLTIVQLINRHQAAVQNSLHQHTMPAKESMERKHTHLQFRFLTACVVRFVVVNSPVFHFSSINLILLYV